MTCGAVVLFFTAAAMARTTIHAPFTPPAVARVVLSSAGPATFAIWSEEISGRARIRIESLATGRIIDLPPFGHGDMLDPAAASAGDEILVVWHEQTEYFGARIVADGTLLDAAPFLIGSAASAVAPQVAWDGRDFLVVWSITGTRVTHDGLPMNPVPLTSGPYSKWGRVDVGGGGGYALAITQGIFHPAVCGFGTCAPPEGPFVEAVVMSTGLPMFVATPVGPLSVTDSRWRSVRQPWGSSWRGMTARRCGARGCCR